MKIQKAYITSFGCYVNKTFDFRDGLNCILERNGVGKTTLSDFIRAMFYGFLSDNSRDRGREERSKMIPWGHDGLSGSITYEKDGQVYRLERTFGETVTKDTADLVDAATGTVREHFQGTSANIGAAVFGLDAEAFVRTLFLNEDDTKTFVSAAMSEKVGVDFTDSANKEVYERTIQKLAEKVNALLGKNASGSVRKGSERGKKEEELRNIKNQITSVRTEEIALRNEKEELDRLLTEHIEIEKEKAVNEEKEKEFLMNREKAAKKEKYREIATECENRMGIAHRLATKIGAPIPSCDEMNEWQKKALRISIEKKQRKEKQEKLQYEENERREAFVCSQKKKKKERKVVLLLTILFALLSVCAMIFIKDKGAALGCCIAFGIPAFGGLAASLFITVKMKEKFLPTGLLSENPNPELQEERECREFLKKHGYPDEFFATGEAAYEKAMTDLGRLVSDYEHAKKEFEEQLRKRKEKENEKDFASYKDYFESSDAPTLDSIRREKNEIADREKENNRRILKKQMEIDDCRNRIGTIRLQEEEKERIEEEIRAMDEEGNLCKTTLLYLEKARRSRLKEIAEPLMRAFGDYVGPMLSERGAVPSIGEDGHIRIEEGGKTKEMNQYSKGYQDLFYIALRLSLIDAMYSDETQTLILDDPLVHLDARNLEIAKKMIRRASEKHRVLYFTCHESRML